MNKKKVAEELGVTTRTLERHMSAGRIAYTMRKGKTGLEAFFERPEVKRFKAEEKGVTHSPVVVEREAPTSLEQPRPTGENPASQSLVRWQDPEALVSLVLEVRDRLQGAQSSGKAISATVDLAQKLTLTIQEAAALSGLSANHLREAIKAGKLKARIVGRGWRIRPEDLRAYVSKVMK